MSGSVVYFLRGLTSGNIKVGTSRCVDGRLKQVAYAAGEAVDLIGTIPGGRKTEKAVHDRLAAHRLNGEWFSPENEVIDVLNSYLCGGENRGHDPEVAVSKLDVLYVDAAKQLVKELIEMGSEGERNTPETIAILEKTYDLPGGLLWSLIYRAPSALTAGQMESICIAYEHLVGVFHDKAVQRLKWIRAYRAAFAAVPQPPDNSLFATDAPRDGEGRP